MKLSIPTKTLQDTLNRLAHIPGAAPTLLYTQAIRIECTLAGVTFTRFTAEAKIMVTVEEGVTVEDGDGSFSVGQTALSHIVNRLQAKEVALTSDKTHLHYLSGQAKGKIATFTELDADGTPPAGEMETESIDLPIEDLCQWLKLVKPAMSGDKTTPLFCGICVRKLKDNLMFMATDRRRGHVVITDYEMEVDCVIPAEAVEAIVNAAEKECGACKFSIGENTVAVIAEHIEISVALLCEKWGTQINEFLFQDASSIESKITIHRDTLVDALKTLSGVPRDDAKLIDCEVTKKGLNLFATNKADSDMAITVNCAATKADKFGLPSMQFAGCLELVEPEKEGRVELTKHIGVIFARSENRIAFAALAKPVTA